MMFKTSFLGPSYALYSGQVATSLLVTSRRCGTRPSVSCSQVKATLSEPFPLFDLFSFPIVSFSSSPVYSDFRPELVGACLWTSGLYLGFSQRERWGTFVRLWLRAVVSKVLSHENANLAADFLHSLPFLIAGFGIDGALRYLNGSNALWAVALGLSVAMYGGIYELARQSARAKKINAEDMDSFHHFKSFSDRRLVSKGRCHLVDIRDAARRDPSARLLGYVSDETLRKYIRNRFPRAVRSPNGYYRGLSIRGMDAHRGDAKKPSSPSLPE